MSRTHEQADNITRANARATGRDVNLPAAFYAWTGTIPRNISPANYDKAKEILRMLKHAKFICHGDFSLTRNEHTRLGKLITKWERRASGKDARFNIMGTRPGRPTKEQQTKLERAGWVSSHKPVKSETVYNKHCIECGSEFQTTKKAKKYCDGRPRCRTRRFERLKRKQPPMEGRNR